MALMLARHNKTVCHELILYWQLFLYTGDSSHLKVADIYSLMLRTTQTQLFTADPLVTFFAGMTMEPPPAHIKYVILINYFVFYFFCMFKGVLETEPLKTLHTAPWKIVSLIIPLGQFFIAQVWHRFASSTRTTSQPFHKIAKCALAHLTTIWPHCWVHEPSMSSCGHRAATKHQLVEVKR